MLGGYAKSSWGQQAEFYEPGLNSKRVQMASNDELGGNFRRAYW